MKRKNYLILLLMLPFIAFSQNARDNSFEFWLLKTPTDFVKEELNNSDNFLYMKSLQTAIKDIIDKDTIVDYEIFLNAIPKTESEFSIYFACDYEEDETIRLAWEKLDNMMLKNARKDNDFFILYLKLSEFVDGYYAERYFDDVEYLIKLHTTVFCSAYQLLNNECQRRLENFYRKYRCENK